jgi:hypothetical protein
VTTYYPGDVVNGHRLNETGTAWIPVDPYPTGGFPAPPAPPAPKRGMSMGKKIGLGVGGGFLALAAVGTVLPDTDSTPAGAPAVAAPSKSPSQQPTTGPAEDAAEQDRATGAAAPAAEQPAEDAAEQPAEDAAEQPAEDAAEDAGTGTEDSAGSGSSVAIQEFTQPGDNPDADLAFTVMARVSPSIDADKGWSDRRILTLGGEAARMWENGASEGEVASYLQDNDMTMLTSYYFMGGAISTYCSTDAVERYAD